MLLNETSTAFLKTTDKDPFMGALLVSTESTEKSAKRVVESATPKTADTRKINANNYARPMAMAA